LVIDLGQSKDYKVGSLVVFHLKYMGALGLLNSEYIEKMLE
jgi:ornithine racemase